MCFRVTFSLSFGIQSHFFVLFHVFWVTVFLSFGVQSHFHAHSCIRCQHLSLVWRSEPLYIARLGTLSHRPFVFWRSKSFPPQLYHSKSQSPVFISTSIAHIAFMGSRLSSFSSPCHHVLIAYHLFAIVLPDFPSHCSWHGPLSSRFVFLSCYWAPYTYHFHIVHIGQPPSSIVCSALQSGSTLTHLWYGLSSPFWRRLRVSLGLQCGFKDILRHHFLLGLEPRCSSIGLSGFVFH